MVPKLGSNITRVRLLRFVSRTPVAPLIFSTLSIIGIKSHKGGTYMQACTHPPKILILRISRFREAEDGSTLKLHSRVAIPCQVHIPCYREVGPACDLVMYTIVACVLRCGATSQAGHYTTRFINHLPPQAAPHAPPQWKADDSKPVEPVKTEPMRDAVLSQQCYVILLCRS